MARPAISEERISVLPNGDIKLKLKTPWRDGSEYLIFSPTEFLERLLALIPLPRFHLTRYYGVFAPASPHRKHLPDRPRPKEENNGKTLRVKNERGQQIEFSPRRFSSFTVYEKRQTDFAVGDKVRFTRNNKTLGVRNGQDAMVASIDEKSIYLKSSDNKLISIGRNELAHIDHNYVNTIYSSQGKTCDHVIVCADDTFGKEAMYVSASRAKFGVQIFCEDKEKLVSLASESRAKDSAVDLIRTQIEKFEKEAKKDFSLTQPLLEKHHENELQRSSAPKQEAQQSQTREVEYDYSIGM